MWKAAMCVSALVILAFESNAVPAQPECNMVFSNCYIWQFQPGDTGPYPGYECRPKDPQRSRTATPQPGQTIQAVDLPNYEQCGRLYRFDYDPETQAASNFVYAGSGCGGNQGTSNCYEPPGA